MLTKQAGLLVGQALERVYAQQAELDVLIETRRPASPTAWEAKEAREAAWAARGEEEKKKMPAKQRKDEERKKRREEEAREGERKREEELRKEEAGAAADRREAIKPRFDKLMEARQL